MATEATEATGARGETRLLSLGDAAKATRRSGAARVGVVVAAATVATEATRARGKRDAGARGLGATETTTRARGSRLLELGHGSGEADEHGGDEGADLDHFD